jgi:Protein of unknown function, DUF547
MPLSPAAFAPLLLTPSRRALAFSPALAHQPPAVSPQPSMSLGPLSFFLRPAVLNPAPAFSPSRKLRQQSPQPPPPIIPQKQDVSQYDQDDPSAELRARIQDMYVDNVTEQGVDYPALVASPAYDAYKAAVASLTNYPAEDLLATDAAKVVFFVNLYNTLTIHAFAELGPPAENSLARLLFNSQASYIVGGHRLSLSDIENGILRGNRGVSMWPRPFGTTPESDPRVRLCVDVPEPRIHFVLNCGAASCPPIRFLTVDRLDAQLTLATSSFLYNIDNFSVTNSLRSRAGQLSTPLPGSPVSYTPSLLTPPPSLAPDLSNPSTPTHSVTLSAIFRWYKTDFAQDGSDAALLHYIASCAEPNDRNERLAALVAALAADPSASRISVRYAPYDWSLNSYKAAPGSLATADVDDDDSLNIDMRC